MKKVTTQLFALTAALFFLLFGKGVNIMSFCCESCAEHGTEMMVSKSCSEVHNRDHHHQPHEAHHACCNAKAMQHNNPLAYNQEANSCHLYRLHVEEPILDSFSFSFNPTVIALATTSQRIQVSALTELQSKTKHQPRPPNLHSCRETLALISVLII